MHPQLVGSRGSLSSCPAAGFGADKVWGQVAGPQPRVPPPRATPGLGTKLGSGLGRVLPPQHHQRDPALPGHQGHSGGLPGPAAPPAPSHTGEGTQDPILVLEWGQGSPVPSQLGVNVGPCDQPGGWGGPCPALGRPWGALLWVGGGSLVSPHPAGSLPHCLPPSTPAPVPRRQDGGGWHRLIFPAGPGSAPAVPGPSTQHSPFPAQPAQEAALRHAGRFPTRGGGIPGLPGG